MFYQNSVGLSALYVDGCQASESSSKGDGRESHARQVLLE